MSDLFSLEGKRAVITGCATGIGQGIATGLAQAGADVVGIDIAELKETARNVETAGRQFYSYTADLSNTQEIEEVWNKIVAEIGEIDILFNNAGMQYRKSAFDYPVDMFDQVIAVNLRAAFLLSQKAGRHFRGRGCKGKIINTASLFSIFGGMDVSGYTCSKHGIMGLTKALSNEFAPYGICVNAIAPGYIQTELTKAVWSDQDRRKPMDARIPAGRWGTPEDFVGVGVFLASAASDYITGVMIPVDGGYSVR
ncbi:MAG TPA: SDR family oxidoreductase [Candidatus Enterocloster excrementipullorum]|uniref:SDR family oxidoreductase n=1 Tax=Candidatus Enterocloster excrementipullorum TaxID=2838559 RepID=A0A9D2N0X0_9FIRM|nr:SDR family oxidoreductase [Candidatus Enterocloster excrementipullorum]